MKILQLALIGGLFAAGSAMGADATFENHLTSAPMVSPAQIYQIEDIRTDFTLGYTSTDASYKPEEGDKQERTVSGTDLFAAGIYNIKGVGLRTGLIVNYGSSDKKEPLFDETTGDSTDVKTAGTDFVVSPTAAMPIGPVVVGAAVDVVQRSEEPEEGKEQSVTFTRFRPGVLFQNKDLEAGVAYTGGNNKTSEGKEDKLAVQEPAKVTTHGRFAIDKNIAAGGIIENVHYKGLDEDTLKDQTRVKGTGEFGAGAVKVEGDLGYNTAFYKSKTEGFGPDTISTMELGAGADYSVNKDTAIGGGLAYEFGSDSADGAKVDANALTLAVRGNMKF